MKKIPFRINLPITIGFLIVSALIINQLLNLNEKVSSGQDAMKIHATNWGSVENISGIINFWRQDETRLTAVKNAVTLDLIFMVIYCSFLCLALYTQYEKDKPGWLKKWLKIGIPCIIIFTAIAAFQGISIYYLAVTPGSEPFERRYLTYTKWTLCALGLIPLLLSLIPFRKKNLG